MKGNSIRPKGVVISILNLVIMDRNLTCPHEINFRKYGANGKVVSVVPYVWDWVSVGNSASFQGSVISTWPSTGPSWARDGWRMTKVPRLVGLYRPATCRVELSLGYSQVVRSKAA